VDRLRAVAAHPAVSSPGLLAELLIVHQRLDALADYVEVCSGAVPAPTA
jgi:hypothetical protein